MRPSSKCNSLFYGLVLLAGLAAADSTSTTPPAPAPPAAAPAAPAPATPFSNGEYIYEYAVPRDASFQDLLEFTGLDSDTFKAYNPCVSNAQVSQGWTIYMPVKNSQARQDFPLSKGPFCPLGDMHIVETDGETCSNVLNKIINDQNMADRRCELRGLQNTVMKKNDIICQTEELKDGQVVCANPTKVANATTCANYAKEQNVDFFKFQHMNKFCADANSNLAKDAQVCLSWVNKDSEILKQASKCPQELFPYTVVKDDTCQKVAESLRVSYRKLLEHNQQACNNLAQARTLCVPHSLPRCEARKKFMANTVCDDIVRQLRSDTPATVSAADSRSRVRKVEDINFLNLDLGENICKQGQDTLSHDMDLCVKGNSRCLNHQGPLHGDNVGISSCDALFSTCLVGDPFAERKFRESNPNLCKTTTDKHEFPCDVDSVLLNNIDY